MVLFHKIIIGWIQRARFLGSSRTKFLFPDTAGTGEKVKRIRIPSGGGTFVPNWIPWLLAGIYTGKVAAIWFAAARRDLERAKQRVDLAIRQVRLLMEGCSQGSDGSHKRAGAQSLSPST